MIKKLLIALVIISVALAGTGIYFYQQFQSSVQQPIQVPEAGLTYRLKPGMTIRSLGRELHGLGVIQKPRYFEWLARKNKQTTAIRAGEYHLQSGLTMETMLDLFVTGKTIQHKFVIIEGTRFTDVLESLSAVDNLEQNFNKENFVDELKGWTGEDYPEGWFYPDTYYYSSADTAKDLLLRAYEKMKSELITAWENRQPDLPLQTPYEALILASIVEKETAIAEERPLIAGVFINRLRKNMKLQTDPTVIYGMGKRYKGNIRKRDLLRDTPYNTYTRRGLPPTPIAMPAREALMAAVKPADTQALYFVARGDGSHIFTNTFREHNAAVQEFQVRKRKRNYRSAPTADVTKTEAGK